MDSHYRDIQHYRLRPRRHLSIALLFFAIATGCNQPPEPPAAQPAATARQPAPAIVIVALGNSLTAGLGVDESQSYPFLLEKKLHADGYDITVINAGVSGETSSGARSRLNWVISSLAPDIVILETGANDGLRGIDPNLLRDNLNGIITVLRDNDIDVILADILKIRGQRVHAELQRLVLALRQSAGNLGGDRGRRRYVGPRQQLKRAVFENHVSFLAFSRRPFRCGRPGSSGVLGMGNRDREQQQQQRCRHRRDTPRSHRFSPGFPDHLSPNHCKSIPTGSGRHAPCPIVNGNAPKAANLHSTPSSRHQRSAAVNPSSAVQRGQ